MFDGSLAKTIVGQVIVSNVSANGQYTLEVLSSLDGINFESVAELIGNARETKLGFTSNDSGTKLQFKLSVSASTGTAQESVTAQVLWDSKPF